MQKMLLPVAAVSGSVVAPGSKSFAQRALLVSAMANGISRLRNFSACGDCIAAMDLLRSLGCKLNLFDGGVEIDSANFKGFNGSINIGESALLARLVSVLSALNDSLVTISGEKTILRRNMTELINVLRLLGCEVNSVTGGLPLSLRGSIVPGEYKIDGSKSSQIISALLMALPLCSGDSRISVENPVSRPYIDITIQVLSEFGIDIYPTVDGYSIRGSQAYVPTDYNIEGDWSSAAPFLVMGALGGSITVSNLNPNSLQADRVIVDILKNIGADVMFGGCRCSVSAPLSGIIKSFECDLTDSPDLFPVVAVLAFYANGVSVLKGTSRLANKESDRAVSIKCMLEQLGAQVDCSRNDLMVIVPGKSDREIIIDSYSDHRIAMAAAIAAIQNSQPVVLTESECVYKSYPDFWTDYYSITQY